MTEYDLDIYKCGNCGIVAISKQIDCPQIDHMGIYLLNYITMLKSNLRGPIGKVYEFLNIKKDLDLSVKGINDALNRVGDAYHSEYLAIRDRVRISKWFRIDKAGFHVEGKKF